MCFWHFWDILGGVRGYVGGILGVFLVKLWGNIRKTHIQKHIFNTYFFKGNLRTYIENRRTYKENARTYYKFIVFPCMFLIFPSIFVLIFSQEASFKSAPFLLFWTSTLDSTQEFSLESNITYKEVRPWSDWLTP